MTFSQTVGAAPGHGSLEPTEQVAQALASRICHDLVSPVGAVVNGMDLLQEMAGMPATEEISLIAQSARRSADVLAFHRLAFGAAGPESAQMARPTVLTTIDAMLAGPRVTLSSTGNEGPALERTAARALALAALCARGLMGMRGALVLTLSPDASLPMQVVATGVDLERKGALARRLQDPRAPTNELDPRSIEFLLVHTAIEAAQARISVDIDGGTTTLTMVRP
ncbi:MAG: histidine phosphotransferase family protein [Pseudomonadota bacterium]